MSTPVTEYMCDLTGQPFNGTWSPAALERRKRIQLGHARGRAHDAHDEEIERKMRAGQLVNRGRGPAQAGTFSRPEPLIPLLARDRSFDWYASVHEASHAVAALAQGCQVTRVFVTGGRGYTSYSAPRSRHAEAVIAFAGPMGEALLTDSEQFLDASRSDYNALTKLNLSADERTAARADATKLLAAKQKKIELFSDWLSQWGVMDGYEAEKLFRDY